MTPPCSEVFKQTYENYLRQILELDFLAKADILGLEREKDTLIIPVYNSIYRFNDKGIEAVNDEEVSAALRVIICKYILTCSLEPVAVRGQLQPYREFKNAGPLVSHFTTNTTLFLEKTFAGKVATFEKRCIDVGGELQETEVYDLSFRFYALPRIPVIVNFNDSDEMFPAACSILYNSTAESYLDMECLSLTGTLLSRILTKSTSL